MTTKDPATYRNVNRDERCSLKEFTNKRREILLLNLAHQTQQEEIAKLHADLQEKEAELKKKEGCLKDSMRRFDSFLKELDKNAQQAAKSLEEQQQITATKESLVKDLKQQLAVAESALRQYT